MIVFLTSLFCLSIANETNESFKPVPSLELSQISQLEKSCPQKQSIYFIRHGESILNKPNAEGVRITSGKSLQAPLTTLGEQQAVALAKQLATKINPNQKIAIVASTAQRAQQTARLIFESLQSQGFLIERGKDYDGLCELGVGEWEGQPKDEYFEAASQAWENLSQAQKFRINKVEGGESFTLVAKRASHALHQICQDHDQITTLAVSHFHTMNALALTFNGQVPLLSESQCLPLPFLLFDNCDLLEVEIISQDESKLVQIKTHLLSQIEN